MKKDSGSIIGMIGIMFLYILIGIAGAYMPFIYIFFPLLGIPLTLWVYKKNIGWIWSLGIIIPLFMSMIGKLTSGMFLLLIIGIPSVLCGYQMRTKDNIPQIIFTTGLVSFVSFFIFSFYLYIINGMDVPTLYYSYVERWQTWFLGFLEEQQNLLETAVKETINSDVLFQYYGIMRMATKEISYYLQSLFPGILLSISMISALIHVLFSGLIIQGMAWKEIQFHTLTQMGVSPIVSVLLFCTWLIVSTTNLEKYWILETTLSNLLFVFSLLFFYLGILLVIYIIRASKLNKILRVLIGLFSLMWLVLSPSFFIFLGFFDGLFNLRRTNQ
ncbi:MAG: DUF2232 domain-containing protein [Epulopiscium sp.]|nr:DUF2232 domain-containing protein [Candidatus Epulonipiscium sp.]